MPASPALPLLQLVRLAVCLILPVCCARTQVGGIPVLVSLANSAVRDMANDVRSNCVGGSARVAELQLVCTALTRISEADEMAYQVGVIVCQLGVYGMGG